jgi:integrase
MASITRITVKGKTRWRARVVTGRMQGRAQQEMQTFDTRREAEAWGREMETAREHGTLADAGKISLGAYLDVWLTSCQTRLRGNTVASYGDVVRLYIIPDTHAGRARARIRLDKLSVGDVQRIIDGAPTHYTGNHARRVLRAALTAARREGYLKVNPAEDTQGRAHRTKHRDAWTAEEAKTFLAAAQQDRYAALWLLWLSCGARPSEFYGLRWDALDLDAGVMDIARAMPYLKRVAYPGLTKSANGERVIPLGPVVVAALHAWRVQQAAERLALGAGWAGADLVFTSHTSRPVAPQNLALRFKRLCLRAGVPPIRMSNLRHTFATIGA